MAIRAYDEIYLSGAQHILGDAADFAVVSPVLNLESRTLFEPVLLPFLQNM